MQAITATVTFTNGTAVVLNTVTAFLGIPRGAVAKIFVEPSDANTHKCYLGDSSLALGTSTVNHVIKRLGKPAAADANLDSFLIEDQKQFNSLNLSEYSMDGTTNEQAQVTVWVA